MGKCEKLQEIIRKQKWKRKWNILENSKFSLKAEMEVSNFDLWNCSWLRIFFENNEPNRFQACTQVRFFLPPSITGNDGKLLANACMYVFLQTYPGIMDYI